MFDLSSLDGDEIIQWFVNRPNKECVVGGRKIAVPDEDAEATYDPETHSFVVTQAGRVVHRRKVDADPFPRSRRLRWLYV